MCGLKEAWEELVELLAFHDSDADRPKGSMPNPALRIKMLDVAVDTRDAEMVTDRIR